MIKGKSAESDNTSMRKFESSSEIHRLYITAR